MGTNEPAIHHRKVGFCDQFGRFLWLLRVTGARPIELRMAEAHNYQGGRIAYRWNAPVGYRGKTAAKTRRDRVIFLPPEARVFVEQCVAKHPTGPIFRTLRNEPWTPQNITQKWRQWLLKQPKVVEYLTEHEIDPDQVRPYNFRHTAISSFLDNGGDIDAAAQIFGTGVKQIERRYGHPTIERLEEQFLKFMPSQIVARTPVTATAS